MLTRDRGGLAEKDHSRETLALYRKRPGGKAATSAPPGNFDRGVWRNAAGGGVLWDLNCSYLETGHFQTAQEVRRWRSRMSGADHWPEDTTREASVAAAEGKVTSFKRRSQK